MQMDNRQALYRQHNKNIKEQSPININQTMKDPIQDLLSLSYQFTPPLDVSPSPRKAKKRKITAISNDEYPPWCATCIRPITQVGKKCAHHDCVLQMCGECGHTHTSIHGTGQDWNCFTHRDSMLSSLNPSPWLWSQLLEVVGSKKTINVKTYEAGDTEKLGEICCDRKFSEVGKIKKELVATMYIPPKVEIVDQKILLRRAHIKRTTTMDAVTVILTEKTMGPEDYQKISADLNRILLVTNLVKEGEREELFRWVMRAAEIYQTSWLDLINSICIARPKEKLESSLLYFKKSARGLKWRTVAITSTYRPIDVYCCNQNCSSQNKAMCSKGFFRNRTKKIHEHLSKRRRKFTCKVCCWNRFVYCKV
jgi:hypothetical protein